MGGTLLLLLVSLSGLMWMGRRAGALGDRLVREANAREQLTWARPSHVVPPLAGSFTEALDALMPEVLRFQVPSETLFGNDCNKVARGLAPFEALPPSCLQVLDNAKDLLPRVLTATRHEQGGLPQGLRSSSDPQHPYQAKGKAALRMLIRLSSLETLRKLSLGQADSAVDTCLDGLALSREFALGGGLTGSLISAHGYGYLYPACAQALDAARPERKRQALEQLARLREGFPPLSLVVQDEAIHTQLVHYGIMLSEEQRRELLPQADAIVRNGYGLGVLPGPGALARRHWRASVETFDAMVASVALPADERRKALARLDEGLEQRWFKVPPEEAWSLREMTDRLDRQLLRVEALRTVVEVDLARVEKGTWPPALPPASAQFLALEVLQPTEAHLKHLDLTWEEYALVITADTPP
ncbi:hypothetical protein [Hyalangium rubrum]|uniref:Uncharacterized protein n=1 Tax=Hyalangium rubrum TaxID=3103134 RepID=A0ABU5HHE9_9BACT|nr:hypothetical protein [Hyalangium sp. s54d21]MDY7232781.1 hypothetical protein [Hyalangium sp. s54d21]